MKTQNDIKEVFIQLEFIIQQETETEVFGGTQDEVRKLEKIIWTEVDDEVLFQIIRQLKAKFQ